ncbi:NUDIX hydrolase [Nocardioides gansuensis]|uniref:NUDIX hydrolase n=1 Tax=Nocardioides gansuensis TaxID=2138300 RepID=A0A2T8FFG0_9ACTN|nr:NUDIX hydrolase [Nocardioides gansuensis]PVG84444.1 NUDIX hydrolase [Nocardioides gansuensis]
MPAPDVLAAGAVVTRKGGDVLLVHRPRYDDWSFPKGKLDRGEHVTTAAVREVAEETGLDIRLGPPLLAQRYPVKGGRMKAVHYWVGRVVGSDDVGRYAVNEEIDEVAWVSWDKARTRLTYAYDRDTLDEAERVRRKTRALVVLRHGDARSRKAWRGDDRRRPLLRTGSIQAEKLVPVLAAFDVTSVHTSSSTRCVDTVAPYGHTTGWPVKTYDELTEEDATTDAVVELVDELRGLKEGAVLCTHRPVLPTIFNALGVPDVQLEPAELVVVHHRKGKVVATERHRP